MNASTELKKIILSFSTLILVIAGPTRADDLLRGSVVDARELRNTVAHAIEAQDAIFGISKTAHCSLELPQARTINNNLLDPNGRPRTGFAGMTTYDSVRMDNNIYDRDGDGTTVCNSNHWGETAPGLNHKDLSDFACHGVVSSVAGVTVSNAVYQSLSDSDLSEGARRGISYLSFAIAGVSAMALKEITWDKYFETADVTTGRVPLYEGDDGTGLYYAGDINPHGRRSVFLIKPF